MIVGQYINKLNVRSPFASRSLASDLVNVKRRERLLFHNVLSPPKPEVHLDERVQKADKTLIV